MIFIALFSFVVKFGIQGVDDLVNTPLCDLLTQNTSVPSQLVRLYDECLSKVIDSETDGRSYCLAYSMSVFAGTSTAPSNTARRYLQSENSTLPSIPSEAQELIEGIYPNCIGSLDVETCAKFITTTIMGNSSSNQGFFHQCFEPVLENESGFVSSCVDYTLSQASPNASAVYVSCASQYTDNSGLLTCLEDSLPAILGQSSTDDLTNACLYNVYAAEDNEDNSLSSANAALSCGMFALKAYSNMTANLVARASLVETSCAQPMATCVGNDGSGVSCDVKSVLYTCASSIFSYYLPVDQVEEVLASAVTYVLQKASAIRSSSSEVSCLHEVAGSSSLAAGAECVAELAASVKALARPLCEDLFRTQGLGGVATYLAGSLWERALVYRQHEAALLGLAGLLALIGALAFLTLLTNSAWALVRWAVLGSWLLLALSCALNLLAGDVPGGLILLAALGVKAIFLCCIWRDLHFVSECLAIASQCIRSTPSTLVIVMIVVLLEPVWLVVFAGSVYKLTSVALQYQEFIEFLLVLAFLWTETLLRGFLAMILIGIILTWSNMPIDESASRIWKCVSWFWERPSVPSPIRSIFRTLTEHFGSLCLGSFLVAILSLARYLIRKMKKGRCRCCLGCCARLLECAISGLDQFNTDAYVLVVARNFGYLNAAQITAKVLVENQLVLVSLTLDQTVGHVLGICQSSVSFSIAALVGLAMVRLLHLPFTLGIITMALAYLTGYIVMGAARTGVEVGMKTVLMAFILGPHDMSAEHPDYYNKLVRLWKTRHSEIPIFDKQHSQTSESHYVPAVSIVGGGGHLKYGVV